MIVVEGNLPASRTAIGRGILLKGNGLPDVSRDLWSIVTFAAIMLTIGIQRYRQTLD